MGSTQREAVARWGFRRPVQERGWRTVERIASATEELLSDRPFESLTIREIVDAAGLTTGSFYSRFESKEAILPFLYERYDTRLHDSWIDACERIERQTSGLPDACRALVDALAHYYAEHKWLLRALALFARTYPEAIPDELVARRSTLFLKIGGILELYRTSIAHPDPGAAIQFGLFVVASGLRESILFAGAPHASIVNTDSEGSAAGLAHMLYGYLTTGSMG